jgi:5-methylcytosine-specific restriction protein B
LEVEMTVDELAAILAEMYENADEDKVAMIHLFGIRYADVIRALGCSANDIITRAQLSNGSYMADSYKTEISKGITLARYVIERQ